MEGKPEPSVGDANRGLAIMLGVIMLIFFVGLIVVYVVADV